MFRLFALVFFVTLSVESRQFFLGGWKEIKIEDIPIDFQNVAKDFVLHSLNSKISVNDNSQVFIDFHGQPKVQIVNGFNYKLNMVFVETNCLKGSQTIKNLNLKNCKVIPAAKPIVCEVVLHVAFWKKTKKVLLGDCNIQENVLITQTTTANPRLVFGQDNHDIGHIGQFKTFKNNFNKNYSSIEEENYRFSIFSKNMKKAYLLQQLDLGSARYGASMHADLTEAEFQKFYLTPAFDITKKPKKQATQLNSINIPDSFDWRTKGAVSEVKNQGQCGSCWAFSTTGNIEGQWFLKTGKLLSLSEQELVDCDKVDQGCNGGLPSSAYKEIMRLGGLQLEQDYPYRGRNMACSFNKSKVAATVNGSVAISQDEQQIAAWLATNGPISIGINAAAMQFYMGGVAHPWKIFCNPSRLDHGVLIVGYGVKGTEPYWIIKNSWGPSWGEKGYYLVYRGDGVCGLNTMCTSATVA